MMGRCNQCWTFRQSIIMVASPFLLLPVPIAVSIMHPEHSKAGKCAYSMMLMAVYWMTEVIPLSVTALLPVILLPLLGVLKSEDICANYLQDTSMLFVGGLTLAVAVETWQLHKRIALRVLMFVGSSPRWLMLGFMLASWFLSMWISNTATTAMMIPIVQAVLDQLYEHELAKLQAGIDNPALSLDSSEQQLSAGTSRDSLKLELKDVNCTSSEPSSVQLPPTRSSSTLLGDHELEKQNKRMTKCMLLAVAYASSVGGIATLTGTPPNLVMKGLVTKLYAKYGAEESLTLNFGTWLVYSLPIAMVTLVLAWGWLQILYFRCRMPAGGDESVKEVIRKEYTNMGPISFAEILVSIHFGVLALLWITRDPGFAPGWGNLFPDKYVTDATPAMLIAISLFMWPSQRPRFLCCKDRNDSSEISPVPSLLDWATLNRKMPWSVVLLLGGGFALADAAKESGLSSLVGNALSTFAGIPASALVVILGAIVAFLTEVTSNTATATLIIPILGELSIQIGVHPLYLIFPATLACSFAFMLPVATPPNAIVFSYGTLRVRDMVVAGIGMNIMCLAVVALATNTWGLAFFKLGEPPQWVKDQHTTVPTSPAFTGIASTIYSFQNCTGLT